MATAVKAYPILRKYLLDGTMDWNEGDIYIALVASSYAADIATLDLNDAVWADVSAHEITGTGYTAGGNLLTNVAVTNDVNYAYVNADNPEWAGATLTARWMIMYRQGTFNSIVNPLIAAFLLDDTPADYTNVASDFIINWQGPVLTLGSTP